MDIRLLVEYPEADSNQDDDGFFTANGASGNDSSDSEDASSSNGDGEDINYENTSNLYPPQPARNHSYLPTAQPLCPEEWCPTGKHRSQLCRKNNSLDTSTSGIKEEEDVDVVAANAIQVGSRVLLDNTDNTDTDTPYYHYDIPPPPGLQSHNVNNSNSNTLAVMEIEDVVLFPGSVLPLRLTDRRWVNHLRNLINDARGLYGLHSSSGGMGEVRIVILPKSDRNRRTRRQPREGGGRTGRWQVGLIRRGVTGMSRRLRRRRMRESDEAETNHEAAEQDTVDANRREERNENNHESEQSDDDGEDDIFHPSDRPLSTILCDVEPLVGRMGTLATITFTHEDTAASANTDHAVAVGNEDTTTSSRVWQNRGDELVLTVLGTKRVRLMRSMGDEKRDQNSSIPLYDVEEIRDESTIPPPIWMLQSPGIRSPVTTQAFIDSDVSKEEKEEGDKSEDSATVDYDNKALQFLESRTSAPAFAYQIVWPWKLCRKICCLIQEAEQFKGIRDILQSAAGLRFDNSNDESPKIPFQIVDPSAFSDWLASNVPLSFNERMDMLEMICTIDRLRFILKMLEKSKKGQSSIRCKHCGATISQMLQIFSVGGSEGTTGAYVNCHGIVHHTMTLRDIEAQSVICIGQPETKDSWFPGYSWQISYCSTCHDHLGWKFRKAGQRSDENDNHDRPKSFWGFSSVTTDERDVQPRRVQFRTRDD